MLTRIRSSRKNGVLWFATALWATFHAALSGCVDGSPRGPEPKMSDSAGIVVTTLDGTRFEGTPMQIHVSEGAKVGVQGTITAHARTGRTWNATFGLAVQDVRRGTVALQRRPLAEGLGMVALNDPANDLRDFDSGALTFILGSGHTVEGRTTTIPASGSATISGKYVLGCWVSPQTLGQAVNGYGDGTTRVQDIDFTSAFCKQFADLR